MAEGAARPGKYFGRASLDGVAEAGLDSWGITTDLGQGAGQAGGEAADDASDGLTQQIRPVCAAHGQARAELVEAEDMEQAGKVVAERHQAPFAADLVEPADQEVAIAGPAFERAERMLCQRLAPSHHALAASLHARPVPLDHVFMHPALDLTPVASR